MRTFTAVVERDAETGLYVGWVPVSRAHSQGATLDELRENLREVVEMLLEDGTPQLQSDSSGSDRRRGLTCVEAAVLKPREVVALLTKLGFAEVRPRFQVHQDRGTRSARWRSRARSTTPSPGRTPSPSTAAALNPNLRGRDIREAFKGDEYQILLVANKFQTGFDQPLLCGMYVDKRLAGIQAVQTLSRLNRAYPGKDTTYVLDFVNDGNEVLEAFKTYYETAQLASTTDPNLVFDLRAKLDAAGYYDDFEVDRVVGVELDPKAKQGDLVAALEPVVDRLLKRYKAYTGGAEGRVARGRTRRPIKAAQDELDALALFKNDMGAFVRLYTFLSQIFDYGNTDIEKRAIFFRRLLPLLDFGRERPGIDLSKVVLTHHALKPRPQTPMLSAGGNAPLLPPIEEAGSGQVRENQTAYMAEIIEKVNDLFDGDLTDQDKLVYVNDVLMGKLLESNTLRQQAANNTKEQFATSPDLNTELLNAIIGALDAHTAMSSRRSTRPTCSAD